jgi:hypothetical protein
MKCATFVWLASVSTALIPGCRETDSVKAYDRGSGEKVKVPDDLAAALRENAQLQSKGLKAASTEVHRAYVYNDDNGYFDSIDLGDGFRIIAVDVTFRNYADGFDLDDVDIIDADTGENFGSDPHLEGIVGDGELADIDDPDVWAGPDRVRVLLVYAPPKSTSRIKLGYWGDILTPDPISLAPGGRQIAKDSITSVVCWKEGSAGSDYDRYVGVLAVRSWYRNRLPDYANLKCDSEIYGDLDRFIEIDEDGNPVTAELTARPYLIERRRFLLEFWVPTGQTPVSFNYWGEEHSVRLERTAVAATTMAALDGAPINGLARHRLDEN